MDRALTTRAKSMTLRARRVLAANFSGDRCARHQREEQTLRLALFEMDTKGACTLQVPWITKDPSDAEISQSAVSASGHPLRKGICKSAPPMATIVASLAAVSSARRALGETVSGMGPSSQPGPSACSATGRVGSRYGLVPT